MTRLDAIIRALCAFWLLAAAGFFLDDVNQHSRIERVHASYVQACRMTLDESADECEARFQKALSK